MKMDNNSKIEEWRPIQGYEELYEVSSEGKVRSIDRYGNTGYGIRLYKGKILNPGKNRGGYLNVVLSKKCIQTTFKVHRLVASAFPEICGEYVNGLEVDHINTVRTDNRATNLRWCTRSGNHLNPITRQRYSDSRKGKFGKLNSNSKPIIQLDLEGNFIAEWDSEASVERKLGISTGCIRHVLKGRCKQTHGFIFRYKIA